MKVFHEYKCLSLIVLNNEHLWPRQHESISLKTLMVLKPRILFSPVIFPRLRYTTTMWSASCNDIVVPMFYFNFIPNIPVLE